MRGDHGRQIQDRLAQLLSEEVEPSSTPPLPTSRILEEELARGSRALRPPGGTEPAVGGQCPHRGARALESFYGQPGASSGAPMACQVLLPVGQVGSRGEEVAAPAAAPKRKRGGSRVPWCGL